MSCFHQPRTGCMWLGLALIAAAALLIILATLAWNTPTT